MYHKIISELISISDYFKKKKTLPLILSEKTEHRKSFETGGSNTIGEDKRVTHLCVCVWGLLTR